MNKHDLKYLKEKYPVSELFHSPLTKSGLALPYILLELQKQNQLLRKIVKIMEEERYPDK